MGLLSVKGVSFDYPGRPVLDGLALDLGAGELAALIGPNGSGKTTLLHLIDGILKPGRGAVVLNGLDLRKYAPRELARRVALVPQELRVAFGFIVREMVMLGRTPYARAFSGPSAADWQVVEEMLHLTGTQSLASRHYSELSGGEQQRVAIAMALAQQPQVLLLDEPTVHLDINHQVEVLELVRKLNRERGLTVLATMHDLNLAALYFDRMLLLHDRRIIAQGAPAQVITSDRIQATFHARVSVQPHPVRRQAPQISLPPPAE